MKHKSNALQDVYLIQTHFKLEKFAYYESLMKQVYAELELKHCMLEELQSRIEALEKTKESLCRALDDAGDSLIAAGAKIEALEKDAERYRWLRNGNDEKNSRAQFIAQNMYGLEWDSAIDTAMQSEKGGM